MKKASSNANGLITRRTMIQTAGVASLAAPQLFRRAHAMAPESSAAAREYQFLNDPDRAAISRASIHGGKGEIDVKFFFSEAFDSTSKPAVLLIYDIPPGASEGVHTHHVGDTKEGSFDEFYYILQGKGEMKIAGKPVAVAQGDHIFTPNGISHGIENTSKEGNLRVYLVALIRA